MMANLARACDATLDHAGCQALVDIAPTLIGPQYARRALLWHHRPVAGVFLPSAHKKKTRSKFPHSGPTNSVTEPTMTCRNPINIGLMSGQSRRTSFASVLLAIDGNWWLLNQHTSNITKRDEGSRSPFKYDQMSRIRRKINPIWTGHPNQGPTAGFNQKWPKWPISCLFVNLLNHSRLSKPNRFYCPRQYRTSPGSSNSRLRVICSM